MALRGRAAEAAACEFNLQIVCNELDKIKKTLSDPDKLFLLLLGGLAGVSSSEEIGMLSIFPKSRITNLLEAESTCGALALAFGLGNVSICELIIKAYQGLTKPACEALLVELEQHSEVCNDKVKKENIKKWVASFRKILSKVNESQIGFLLALEQLKQEFQRGPGLNPYQDAYQVAELDHENPALAKKLVDVMRFRQTLQKSINEDFPDYESIFNETRRIRREEVALAEAERKAAIEKEAVRLAEEANRIAAEKEKAEVEEKKQAELKRKAQEEVLARAREEVEIKSIAQTLFANEMGRIVEEKNRLQGELKVLGDSLIALENETKIFNQQKAKFLADGFKRLQNEIEMHVVYLKSRWLIRAERRAAKKEALEFLRQLSEAGEVEAMADFIDGIKSGQESYSQKGKNFKPVLAFSHGWTDFSGTEKIILDAEWSVRGAKQRIRSENKKFSDRRETIGANQARVNARLHELELATTQLEAKLPDLEQQAEKMYRHQQEQLRKKAREEECKVLLQREEVERVDIERKRQAAASLPRQLKMSTAEPLERQAQQGFQPSQAPMPAFLDPFFTQTLPSLQGLRQSIFSRTDDPFSDPFFSKENIEKRKREFEERMAQSFPVAKEISKKSCKS